MLVVCTDNINKTKITIRICRSQSIYDKLSINYSKYCFILSNVSLKLAFLNPDRLHLLVSSMARFILRSHISFLLFIYSDFSFIFIAQITFSTGFKLGL